MLHNKRLGTSYDLPCTGSAVLASVPVPIGIRYMRLAANGPARVSISPQGNVPATATSPMLIPTMPEVFCVNQGDIVSVYGTSGTTVNCTEML